MTELIGIRPDGGQVGEVLATCHLADHDGGRTKVAIMVTR
jgi:hypothetical protein